ncbi:LysR family transcriptional regulator [Angustibacter sp. McL0619]|uniref:LysR family transcriptional regulator n=1 Tax=Angustibacter sp. McL0619 TaxID=3415676 RepID=UPI003CEDDE69
MIDVNALRVVRAIGDEGGFTAAANALGYSQPAVSQLVRRLEQRIGTPLVERHGRSVRLTEAGQVLARHAVTVQAALDTADEEIAAITGLRAGRVRVMAFPSSSASVVPRALADLRARHPGLQVTFSEGEPPQSLAALRSGECDVAVAFTYPGTGAGRDVDDLAGLLTVPLLDDELHVVLPADHPLADQRRIGLDQLRDQPWIAGCPRCRGHLMSLAERDGFTPRVEFETDDYVAVMGLVAEGLGVALVPGLVLRTTTHQAVVTRPLHPTSLRSVLAVTTSDLRRVPAVDALITSLQSASR